MTNQMIKFDLPKNQSSIIKVLGVGGGGSNAVNNMFRQGIEGVDFVVCNTDSQALELSPVPNKIQLGVNLTEGRGAGNDPEIGKKAALEDLDHIKEMLEKNTRMVFITAGMGGGTGTGAAPVIAKLAREMGILTVAIVTQPFSFEGNKRIQQAKDGILKLKEHVDTLLTISNDRIIEIYGKLSINKSFAIADNVLTNAARGIAEVITLPGIVNVDFEDVRTVLTNSGVALMGTGCAEGENRAIKAVELAINSPLLNDNNIRGAKNILLNVTYGSEEVLSDEILLITDYIKNEAGNNAEIIWGLCHHELIGNNISITLLATGFTGNQGLLNEIQPQIVVRPLEKPQKMEEPIGQSDFDASDSSEIKLINKKSLPDKTRDHQQHAYTFDFPLNEELQASASKKVITKGNESLVSGKRTISPPEISPVSEEELLRKMREREQRLKDLSIRLKSTEGLKSIEDEPAYIRRHVQLSNVPHSSDSQVSRYTLNEEKDREVQIKSNNSFLHDNVD
ncbi:MAG TPA: cell division protein FtsZ [Bacteroidales bacterium]|nr:cell division protein FtsZ [Bacteroidales bacterium]